jgi:hypothetical protein
MQFVCFPKKVKILLFCLVFLVALEFELSLPLDSLYQPKVKIHKIANAFHFVFYFIS